LDLDEIQSSQDLMAGQDIGDIVDSDRDRNRGLLDLDVTQSSQDLMAGQDFSVYVIIKNPFDIPIWIKRVHVSVPSEIHLPQWNAFKLEVEHMEEMEQLKEENRKAALKEEAKRRSEIIIINEKIDELENQIEKFKKDGANCSQKEQDLHEFITKREELLLLSEGFSKIGAIMEAQSGGKIIIDNFSSKDQMHVIAGSGGEIIVNKITNILGEEDATISRSVDLMGSLPEGAALQPGNTAVYTIIMKTKNLFLFRPSQYRLQFNVNYSFEKYPLFGSNSSGADDKGNSIFTNTIAATLSIRASIYSVIIGSAIGGLFGALARFLQSESILLENLVSIALSVILSIAAIIFLARKSGAQSFVSVEDLWGGILIGFLVGYSGVSFFENLAGI